MSELKTKEDLKNVNTGSTLWHVNPYGYSEKSLARMHPERIDVSIVSCLAFHKFNSIGDVEVEHHFSDLIGYDKKGIKKTFTSEDEAEDYCNKIKEDGQFQEVIDHHNSCKTMFLSQTL